MRKKVRLLSKSIRRGTFNRGVIDDSSRPELCRSRVFSRRLCFSANLQHSSSGLGSIADHAEVSCHPRCPTALTETAQANRLRWPAGQCALTAHGYKAVRHLSSIQLQPSMHSTAPSHQWPHSKHSLIGMLMGSVNNLRKDSLSSLADRVQCHGLHKANVGSLVGSAECHSQSPEEGQPGVSLRLCRRPAWAAMR